MPLYGPPGMESAISASGAGRAKQPRRETALIRAKRRLAAAVASAADPAIGPVIAPGPAERRRRAPGSHPSASPRPLVSALVLPWLSGWAQGGPSLQPAGPCA